MKKEEAATV